MVGDDDVATFVVAKLAQALPEATILLGPCERPLNTRNPIIENLSLEDVADQLRHCRVFIGNDSGITHLAAAVATPVLAIFGPTDPEVWAPRGAHVRIARVTSIPTTST